MKSSSPWLAAAAIIFIVFGTMYGVVQQVQRTDANYPQIQLAEDAAASLNQGTSPAAISSGHVAMRSSLAPFVIIYDQSGRAVGGSGYLNGHLPAAPYGILTAARGHAYRWVSWQPESDVRIAAVTVAADNYYVLSGRSLREIEINENHTLQITALGCALSLIALGTAFLASRSAKKPVR